MGDYYDILGIKSDATSDEVKAAYRGKAFELHPDTNPAGGSAARKQFQAAKDAYETLRDPIKRAEYDRIINKTFDFPSFTGRGGFPGRTGFANRPDFAQRSGFDRPNSDAEQDPFDWWYNRHNDAEQERRWKEAEAARVKAWFEEKKDAQAHKERFERQRQRAMNARQERAAKVLRGLWQTHAGVTWPDVCMGILFMGGIGLAVHMLRTEAPRVAATEAQAAAATDT